MLGHPPTCMTLAGAMGCSVDAAPAGDELHGVIANHVGSLNGVLREKQLNKAQWLLDVYTNAPLDSVGCNGA